MVFLTLFLVIDFMTSIMRFDVSLPVLARYYGAYSFQILYQFLPIAALVGVIFTLSTLNRARELTALFSLGMSLKRILMPMFLWLTLFVAFTFYLGDQIIPLSKQKRDFIYYNDMKKNPSLFSTVKTDKIWYRAENIIFNIKLLDPENKKAFGLTFYYFSPDWKLQQMISAQSAQINPKSWLLNDGAMTLFVNELTTPIVSHFNKKKIPMAQELTDIQTASSASDFLTFKELGKYIQKNKDAGLNMTSFEVDYHNKLSYPFSLFVLGLIGVPFVIKHQRSGGMAKNIGLIMLMTFAFWAVYSSSMSLGRHGQLPPWVATWGPNILMLAVTSVLFRLNRQ